jgi:hypothetical protein
MRRGCLTYSSVSSGSSWCWAWGPGPVPTPSVLIVKVIWDSNMQNNLRSKRLNNTWAGAYVPTIAALDMAGTILKRMMTCRCSQSTMRPSLLRAACLCAGAKCVSRPGVARLDGSTVLFCHDDWSPARAGKVRRCVVASRSGLWRQKEAWLTAAQPCGVRMGAMQTTMRTCHCPCPIQNAVQKKALTTVYPDKH